MKKLLLACDDYIYHYSGQYYAASQEKYDFYQRYLRIFDKLKLIVRCIEEVDLKDGRILFDDGRIELTPVPMFRGPKEYALSYFKVGKILKNNVGSCDAAILRIPSTVALRMGDYVMKKRIPYGVEVVYDAKDGWENSKHLIEKLLWKKIDAQMIRLCHKSWGVSCVTEFHLQKRYYSLRPGAFASHYSSLALDKSFYSSPRLYPQKSPFIIGHVATQVDFDGVKGHKELIEAISVLQNRGVDAKVEFVGGDYLGGVEKLRRHAIALGVDNKIEFKGVLNRAELSRFYENVDLFVLPTRAEGLPRVIIEALAKALPCVSTNVSGNPELLPDHFLVNYTDVDGIADRIEEIISSKDIYEKVSKDNFNKSLEYESSILEKRRDGFYSSLREFV